MNIILKASVAVNNKIYAHWNILISSNVLPDISKPAAHLTKRAEYKHKEEYSVIFIFIGQKK